jgi:hypothetical protein
VLRFCDSSLIGRAIHREHHSNGRSPPKLAFGLDAAAVHLGDMFDDGETKTGAAELATARLIRSIKTLEDTRQIGLAYADPGVTNNQRDLVAMLLRLQTDLAAGSRVLQGIIEQVVENLLQACLVRANARQVRCHTDINA